jgi:predicted tellurium resistance membrane protein TerC
MEDLLSVLLQPENLIALATLAGLEIVLGIDNIVFISILTAKLPKERQAGARRIGLLLAMGMRIALLLAIGWVMRLTAPLFTWPLPEQEISGRDLILIVGGLFLIGKATWEIHDKLEGGTHDPKGVRAASYGSILLQIVLLDMVFSLDSVITAVGMVKEISIMVIAVVIAVGVMMIFAGMIGAFIERHPTMKILALSFLLLIGVVLLAEGFEQHFSKGYIYSSMAFALFVEVLNMRFRKVVQPPVQLHQSYVDEGAPK